MYFSHISIGGGIVGVETVISTINNICNNLKKKKIKEKNRKKTFSFAIVDTNPKNIPGGVAYSFDSAQYGYFNNPLRLSPFSLKNWIFLKNNKKKIIKYVKNYGGFSGKEWLNKNLHILNSSNSSKLLEVYFPRALANLWMEEKLLILFKKMKQARKKYLIKFEIKFIKGEVISINKSKNNYSRVAFKDKRYQVLKLIIRKNHLKKINFKKSTNLKKGDIFSNTQCVSLGLPPPKELAINKSRDHVNYIRDFYSSGATANLVNKIIKIKKKNKTKKIIIYFVGYKAGLLEPLSELKNVIKKFNISTKIICSSSNLMGMQKAQASRNAKSYKLKILKKNNLKNIKTTNHLILSITREFNLAKKNKYNIYDAWNEILNKSILNQCIKNFNNKEKRLYKNNIFHKLRAITRFTYPETILARDELISKGILDAKKEIVKKIDIIKNNLCVFVENHKNKEKKYYCDIVVNVSGPLSIQKLKKDWLVIQSIKKISKNLLGKKGGFFVDKNFKIQANHNIYLPGYIANAFNPERKTIIRAILENSNIAGKDIADVILSFLPQRLSDFSEAFDSSPKKVENGAFINPETDTKRNLFCEFE